jgi:hypothetical protein
MSAVTGSDSEDRGMAERVLALAGEFMRYIAANPATAPAIPDEATVILLPENDPDLAAYNTRLGMRALANGEDVYFLHVRMTGSHIRTPTAQQIA